MKKIVIVGGVAGGASAAARLRRLDENVEIILFEKGEHISFANCGLPYYIGDIIKNRESLLLQTPEKLKQRFNIDVRINSEVIKISPETKTITVLNNGNQYEETFDYLILSPGAKPIVPNIPGINSSKIFTLRNIKDMDNIKKYILENNISNVTVIGGGYIGIESAENLAHINIATTIIEANKTILSPFDKEISDIVAKELIENGITVLTGHKVIKFEEKNRNLTIYFENGKQLETEMVISAIGVTPDTSFLKESGILLGEKGDILINEFLQTNFKNIYALGDATFSKNLITNKPMFSALAGPANRQGRIVANNILGTPSKYFGGISTAILKVFSLSVASTGINENIAKLSNIPFEKIYLHPNDHASYYPGGTPITIKLLYHKENHRILGAQAIGLNGVDKFIDVIATTIKFKGTFEDLEELELSYAPPYSSAKSPANMAGFIGENIEKNLVEQIYIEDLNNYPEAIILDVREEIELISGTFKNSINIPLTQLRTRYNELDKNKDIFVYCAVGLRGYIATRFLKQNGFKVKNIAGGFNLFNRGTIKNLNQNFNNIKEEFNSKDITNIIDLSGLSCPGPLAKVKEYFDNASDNEVLSFRASDPGFYNDIQAWCNTTKNELININKSNNEIVATIKKNSNIATSDTKIINNKNSMTIIVFSGDLDKAIAAFIIANGALSMGKKVTMFFTFWGLSIIKKENFTHKKSFLEKMFAFMLPKNSTNLPLSKMNMLGIGAKMIRYVMKNKNISSLENLIENATNSGVNIVACSMSMDVMGITKEELIENISIGGVGQYLGEAEKSNNNLFI